MAMSRVHDLLSKSETSQRVNLATYLSDLCEALRPITERDDCIVLSVESDDTILLHADVAIPLGIIATELITNAVVHTGSEPRLEVHMLRDRIRVEVYDDDPNPPTMLERDLTRPGGRGLRLISTLSDRWGTQQAGAGKLVWIELDQR